MALLSVLLAPALSILASLGMGPSFGFSSQTDPNGQAYLEIKSGEAVKGIEVEITGDNGFHLKKTVSVRAGKSTKLTWKQKGTTVTYQLQMTAGDEQTDFEFEVVRPRIEGTPALEMHATAEDIVAKRQSHYRTRFVTTQQHFEVFNTEGAAIVDEKDDNTFEVGANLDYSWDSCDEVFMLRLTAQDDGGRQAIQTNVVWQVNVPHTDVNFDSGKWDIKPEEAPKLDEAYAIMAHELAGLDAASEAVGQKVTAQLYIVGYTDSVGGAADNKALSEKRAKAISKYLVDKGIWCDVYYAGMGERGQRVKTDDSVDEVRNRRALYLFKTHKPAPGGEVPGTGAWRKISDARPRMASKLPELPPGYLEHKEKERARRTNGECGAGSGGPSMSSSDGGGEGGSSSSSSDSGSSSNSGAGPDTGASSDGGGDGGADGGQEAPPPAGETPSSKKGCAVDDSQGSGLLALLGLGLWFRRRRR